MIEKTNIRLLLNHFSIFEKSPAETGRDGDRTVVVRLNAVKIGGLCLPPISEEGKIAEALNGVQLPRVPMKIL